MELVKQEQNILPIIKELEAQGLDDPFIVGELKKIATQAITQNNQGDRIDDYNTRLKALQTILKIKDKTFDRSWINLNFFQAPDINNLKY